jgi:hypothetical protein
LLGASQVECGAQGRPQKDTQGEGTNGKLRHAANEFR